MAETPALANLAAYLFATAARAPERIALGGERGTLDYGTLARRVRRLALALLRLDIRPGDRIAVLTTPRSDAYALFLAANAVGAVWVGLNPRHTYAEMSYVVEDAAPRLLVFLAAFEARSFLPEVERLHAAFPGLEGVFSLEGGAAGYRSLEELAASVPPGDGAALPPADPLAVAMLVYTSGSTGRPKGVMLQNRAMIRRSRNQLERWPLSGPPVVCNPYPMNHIGSLHFVACYALVGGGTIHFTERFDPDGLPDLVARQGINILLLMPTLYQLILASPAFDPARLKGVEWFIYSGAAMPRELLQRLRAIGGRVGTSYGMSETCGSVTYGDPEQNLDTLAVSIGRPSPPGEVRVVQPDGRPCAPGEVGEMQVRRDFAMLGYFRRPEQTAEAFAVPGWLKTGDLAELLPDGNLRFVGRLSDMFKSGGYNVYPREIELALEEHPAVALAAVIGVPDPLFDEVGQAYVVLHPDADCDEAALRAWCRERLANYKIPKAFTLCRDLPLLPVGKVDKVKLRALYAAAVSPASA